MSLIMTSRVCTESRVDRLTDHMVHEPPVKFLTECGVIIASLFLSCSAILAEDSSDPALQALSAVIENRNSVRAGIVEIEARGWQLDGQQKTLQFDHQYRVFFDHDRYNFRVLFHSLDDTEPSHKIHVVIQPRERIVYESNSVSESQLAVVWQHEWDHAEALKGQKTNAVTFDPRMLGLYPASLMRLPDLLGQRDAFLLAENNSSHTIIETDDQIHVSFSLREGTEGTVIVSPQHGNEAIECSVTAKEGGHVITDRIVSQPAEYRISAASTANVQQPDRIWFPESLTHTRRIDGAITRVEEITITSATFSTGIEDVFGLEHMEIPPSTAIRETPHLSQGRSLVWDGNKIAPGPQRTAQFGEIALQQSGRGWLLVAANMAVVAVAAAAFLLWKKSAA